MIPNAVGGAAVLFKSPTGSVSQPATISSILNRSVGCRITRTADRGQNFHNGPSAGSEQSDKNVGEITYCL
jgi:hypothetical protein